MRLSSGQSLDSGSTESTPRILDIVIFYTDMTRGTLQKQEHNPISFYNFHLLSGMIYYKWIEFGFYEKGEDFMSFLKRAIREGIRQGIGDAVSSAVKQAVEPKATEWANKTAQQLDQMSQSHTQEVKQSFSGLEGAFSNLQRAAENYATEVGKNIKVCPGCGEPIGAEKKFCPGCGAKLPETTMAADALCPACGKQNTVGMKYCDECGAKLPAAIAEEEAAKAKMEEALCQWDAVLPMYPRWNCGGTGLYLETHDPAECSGYFASVSIDFPRNSSGEANLKEYWQILKGHGFRSAGKYPDPDHLYKMVDGKCYMASCEHAFEGGMDNLCLEFAIREPEGGFDYVKPEPRQQVTLKDLRNQLGKNGELDNLKDELKDFKKLFRR